MEAINMIKAGDFVLHAPTKEEWVVLGVNTVKNKVCIAGWPPTIANLSDCTLVESRNGLGEKELSYRDEEFGTDWEA